MNALTARSVCGRQEGGPPNCLPPAATRQRRITLPPAPESTWKAREFTKSTLLEWQFGPLVQDAVIVASELVTNAIRHATDRTGESAGAPAGLAWQCDPGQLVCVVTDRSRKPPVLILPCADAESGHGLQIVQALTAAWGWMMLSDDEKAVWAALLTDVLSHRAAIRFSGGRCTLSRWCRPGSRSWPGGRR